MFRRAGAQVPSQKFQVPSSKFHASTSLALNVKSEFQNLPDRKIIIQILENVQAGRSAIQHLTSKNRHPQSDIRNPKYHIPRPSSIPPAKSITLISQKESRFAQS
jgi:hypothetical protein